MDAEDKFIQNINQIHTTRLGAKRIANNLLLSTENVTEWCKSKVKSPYARVNRKGKNWYVEIEDCMITIHANSYTIITAHKIKKHKK